MAKQTQSQSAGASGRQTKAEKKEQARRDRIELQRKMASRKRTRTIIVVAVVAAAALIVGVVVATGGFRDDGVTVELPNPDTLPGMLRTAPPWSNNTEQLPARLQQLALPTLNEQILHHHIRLFIYVDGQPVTVPMNIGLSAQAASPLHTHDTSGTVHVESADANFEPVLGQFFDVWGVYLTKDCLGGRCDDGTSKLRVFVNGNEWDGDATQVPLTDLSAIVVAFGTDDQLPDPMPNTFTFGA